MKKASEPLPHLKEKLGILLKQLGRKQSWLAAELGLNRSRISRIKKDGKVPDAKIMAFCHALRVTPQELELESIDEFKNKRENNSDNKEEGVEWRDFVKKHNEFNLKVQPKKKHSMPLKVISPLDAQRGLSYEQKPASITLLKQKLVSLRQQIEFEILYNETGLSDDIEVITYVLLLEDESGLNIIAPLKQPSKPQASSNAYLFSNDNNGGFYASEPVGQHTAHLLLLSQALTEEIQQDFNSQNIRRAADKLAIWLQNKENKINFSLNSTNFFVSTQ